VKEGWRVLVLIGRKEKWMKNETSNEIVVMLLVGRITKNRLDEERRTASLYQYSVMMGVSGCP